VKKKGVVLPRWVVFFEAEEVDEGKKKAKRKKKVKF
jgi:hypothetical protein